MLERIGKYEIRGELGKGGFGQVYLGFDPTVGRLVAIKVLSADGDSRPQLLLKRPENSLSPVAFTFVRRHHERRSIARETKWPAVHS
jgi:serine/threonine protein kinase